MAATDLLLLLIPVGGIAAYAMNIGGFKDWVDTAFAQGAVAQPGGGAPVAQDTCNKVSTGPSGFRYMCGCAGSTPFAMGAMYNQATSVEACRACKVECNKRKAGFAQSYAYASYPMKGLIVS
jgi:hypothetical protein